MKRSTTPEELGEKTRFSAAAARLLEDDRADEPVDLVVELLPDPGPARGRAGNVRAASRAARIARERAEFEHRAEPVARQIETLGGEVVGKAWINRTLQARVPRSRFRELGSLEGVGRIDRPRTLEPRGT